MTEEIIIDGVNVAGCHNKTPYKNDYGDVQCKCYRFEDIENNTFLFGICKQHPNCYYKQLKRLEQERDEWKKKYEDVANENLKEIYELIKKNDCWRGVVNVVCSKLEQENEELKNEINKLGKKHENYCNTMYWQMKEQIDTYRSALEEIRELFPKQKPWKGMLTKLEEEIYNKINEVIGED